METTEVTQQSVSTRTIKGVLDKDKLSFMDIQTIFQYVTERVKGDGAGYVMLNSVSTEINNDIEYAIGRVSRLGETLAKLEDKITNEIDASWNRLESKWGETQKRITKIQADIKDVSFPEIDIPYNWKQIFEMTEVYSRLNDEQKEAFLIMTKALKK